MRILGVDIGTHEVKTVLMDVGMMKTQVTAANHHAVGDEDRIAIVAEATRGSFDLMVLSVDRRLVVTRNLTLPFKDPVQVAQTVPFEAENQLPFSADEGYIAHYVSDTTHASDTEVLVFAISAADFATLSPLYEATGRADTFHQVDSYGLINALLDQKSIPGGTVAILDLGHSKTCIEILRDGKLVFSRCLDRIGGKMLTQALQDKQQLSRSNAEAAMVAALASEGDRDTREILQPVLDRIINDIRFSFISYQAGGAAPVQKVVLTGGTARAPYVRESIASGLQVEVVTPQSSSGGLPGPVASDFSRYASAYGMALHGQDAVSLLGDRKSEISADFLKEERSFWKYQRKKISSAVTAILVLCLAFVLIQVGQIRRLSSQIETLDVQIQKELSAINKSFAARGRKTLTLEALEAASRESTRRLRILQRGKVSNLGILNEISLRVPRQMNLTILVFNIESGLVTLKCETGSNTDADKIVEAIKASQVFAGVRKTESGPSPSNPTRVQFQVQFKVAS